MPIPGTYTPPGRPPLVTAFVAKAPTAPSDDLLVRIPMFGNALSTAFAWEPRAPLPLVDDECLVAYDERGNPWVVGWVGDVIRPPLVSALPTEPRDGQEVYFQNEAMAAAGVVWHLRYRAASASSHKWEFIGGASLFTEIEAEQGTESEAYVDLASVGPSVTVPLAGVYACQFGAAVFIPTGGIADVGLSINGGIIAQHIVKTGETYASVARSVRVEATASAILKLQYKATIGKAGKYAERFLAVDPVRVG